MVGTIHEGTITTLRNQQVQIDRTISMKERDTIIRHHHHHHLPPWIRSFDLFRHRPYRLYRRELYVPGRTSQVRQAVREKPD